MLAIGWTAAGLAALAVIGHGVAHGGLPGQSLNFRWGYWTATAADWCTIISGRA